MAKKRATAVKTLDDFIDEVNRCDYGRYEIGLNEDTQTVSTLRATIFFKSARWEFIGDSRFAGRTLVLYSNTGGVLSSKIKIDDVQSVELLRGNEFGASYIITAGDINPERHLFSLHYASTGNDIN